MSGTGEAMPRPAASETRAPERAPETEPRIYVASLTDYNAGVLHGAWLSAQAGVDAMSAGIADMLAASPTTARYGDVAEEWAIHDYEGWGGLRLGEYESLETIDRLATGLATHGLAYGAWLELLDSFDEEAELTVFEEHYIGEYSSLEDFAAGQLDDLGFDVAELPGVPSSLRPYVHVDLSGWARDMEIEGAIASCRSPEGVFVFWGRQ